jgi:hypothetical protein
MPEMSQIRSSDGASRSLLLEVILRARRANASFVNWSCRRYLELQTKLKHHRQPVEDWTDFCVKYRKTWR